MTLKSAAVFLGSSLAIGGATYYIYLRVKNQYESTATNCSAPSLSATDAVEETLSSASLSSSLPPLPPPPTPPARPKKVLVLGLKGAGKSSLIKCLTRGAVDVSPTPTTGFNVVQCRIPSHVADNGDVGDADASSGDGWRKSSPPLEMDLWEIGGDDAFRKFWSHFYSDTDCLLFLLDPGAGSGVVGEAAEELARAAGDYRMGTVPIVIVATHQDKRQSQMEAKELRRLLVDVGISPQILLRIHGVATPPTSMGGGAGDADAASTAFGVEDLKNLLSKILS